MVCSIMALIVFSTNAFSSQQHRDVPDKLFSHTPLKWQENCARLACLSYSPKEVKELTAPQLWLAIAGSGLQEDIELEEHEKKGLATLVMEARRRCYPSKPAHKAGILTAMAVLNHMPEKAKKRLCKIMQRCWLILHKQDWFFTKLFAGDIVEEIIVSGVEKNMLIKVNNSKEVYPLKCIQEIDNKKRSKRIRCIPAEKINAFFKREELIYTAFDQKYMTCENMLFTQAPFVVELVNPKKSFLKIKILQERYATCPHRAFYAEAIRSLRSRFEIPLSSLFLFDFDETFDYMNIALSAQFPWE